ncbi:hypothetical protein CC86DRAFT_395275 [Ophiobolus disseminans]|uniref:Uncharacterized protein n=1 Tax=Ophiobolus disseminans TaxID=1469910 RepID=A0A6A6ZWE0_9PLEO|nr:hypothetical protein CC86DRAFT_395275 [Ophiobolus disseminans]
MTKDHRFYHRRQAQAATRILTVNVEIIETVDSSGNVVGQETKTENSPGTPTVVGAAAVVDPLAAAISSVVAPVASPVVNVADSVAAPVLSAVANAVVPSVAQVPTPPAVPLAPSLPQVPSVPPFPTNPLPVVPSVPAFPSDLNVPAYPFTSGIPAQVAQATTGPVIPSPAPTSLPGSSAPPAPIPAPVSASVSISVNPVANSTTTNTLSLSSTASLTSLNNASSALLASVSGSIVPSSRSPYSNVDGTASSGYSGATVSPNAGNPTQYGGAGGVGAPPANTAAPPAQGTAAAGAGATGNTTPLETPQVVGSVVGSLAGAALILAIILMLLRRHKRKRQGALQLSNEETTERASPMTQDLSRNNRIPSAFLNRFSGISRSTIETNTSGGERSFQRVSGRKLPSAFSEGMTSDQFSQRGTMSGSSFYQDDHGTYGGPGLSKEMGKEMGGSPVAAGTGLMNFRPSPARTPVIRHPDDDVNPFADPGPFARDRSHLSPPQSPNPEKPRSTLGRSLQSADGSRSSKFTENV